MRRLRDLGDSADASIARAARLVAAVRPLQILDARVRWARRRLNIEPKRGSLRSLRPAAALLFVFGIAATAGAAYETGKYLMSEYFVPEASVVSASGVSESEVSKSGSLQRKHRGAALKHGLTEPTAIGSSAEPIEPAVAEPTEATPVANLAGAPASAQHVSANPGGTKPRSALTKTPDSKVASLAAEEKPSLESEAALVQRGMQALRQEKDARKAAKILREYEAKNPNGALAEEALVLSIEAASASNDPRAAELASWYLSRYPQGRFRDVAQRALAKRGDR